MIFQLNDISMKRLSNEMICQLERHINKISFRWNGNLMKWHLSEMKLQSNNISVKWNFLWNQIWWNDVLTKWCFDEMLFKMKWHFNEMTF